MVSYLSQSHDCVIIAISVVAMEFGSEVETSNFYLTLCNLTLYNYVHVQYFFQYFEDINPKDTLIFHSDTLKPVWHVQYVAVGILQNQSAAITWFHVIINWYVLWSNALCLNISLMNSLIKPGCTYLMTAFVLCPFISTKKSNFNYFNYWYFNQSQNIQMLQWRRITSLFSSNRYKWFWTCPYIIGCISNSWRLISFILHTFYVN